MWEGLTERGEKQMKGKINKAVKCDHLLGIGSKMC